MRTREKARIWRRFMAGESVMQIFDTDRIPIIASPYEIENIIREGARGKFDAVPMKQARVYAKAAGVKVGRMVKI
jgi:hypothetical protein